MKRNSANLKIYRTACDKVMKRADARCEVMLDYNGDACTDLPKRRCLKYILPEVITWTNFLHTETRNGKSDDWINDPENITLGCASHHYEEGRTGKHVERCEYNDNELFYLPE